MKKGFGVYRPLCFGDRTTLGIERESFVVTEGLSSQSMDGFIVKNFEKLENSEKEQILKDLGKTIRRIHDCDISLPDLYIWHLFINKNQRGQYEFAVIDLHRMKYRVTSSNEKIKNLSRLDYSLRDEYFDENLRRVLIEAYTGDCSREAVDSLFCKVRQGAAKLLRRRKQKPYLTY
jgi:tRNA A-37 threonylcarbamoyl transferase component Bud32